MKYRALSIVAPSGSRIAAGEKTIEVRSWKPDLRPEEDLLIIENSRFLRQEGDTDPDGKAVALVRVTRVRDFGPEDVAAACANRYEPGWFAWELESVRPLPHTGPVLAARGLYEVEWPLS